MRKDEFPLIDAYADSKVNEVLDKIRAEIEQNAYPIVHGVNNHEKGMTLYGVLQIIDKYKAESEPQESGIEKRKPCINYEDGCEEWAGCPCVYYKAESEE
jgi:hypothetical protein